MDKLNYVYELVDTILVDANWYFKIHELDGALEVRELSPQAYYIRPFSKAVYFPFIRDGVKITIVNSDCDYWEIWKG